MVPGMSGGAGETWCRGGESRGMQDKGREGSARAKRAQQKQHHNKDTNVFISYISVYIQNPQRLLPWACIMCTCRKSKPQPLSSFFYSEKTNK